MHAGVREFLGIFSEESTIKVLSHLVDAETRTGARAAVKEGVCFAGCLVPFNSIDKISLLHVSQRLYAVSLTKALFG